MSTNFNELALLCRILAKSLSRFETEIHLNPSHDCDPALFMVLYLNIYSVDVTSPAWFCSMFGGQVAVRRYHGRFQYAWDLSQGCLTKPWLIFPGDLLNGRP